MPTDDDLSEYTTNKRDFFTNFPLREFYRFAIDGIRQTEGWAAFDEHEPGYLQGVLSGLFYAHSIDAPVTVSYLIDLQRMLLHNVEYTNIKSMEHDLGFTKDIFDSGRCSVKLQSNLSQAGIEEGILLEKSPGQKIPTSIGGYPNTHQLAETYLKEYAFAMKNAETNIQKLQAIILMTTKLERLHPFRDGNCRTLCMALLQSEILKIGLLPPIIDDPNRFDGFSQSELYDQIIEGMQRTKELMKEGNILTPFRKVVKTRDQNNNVDYHLTPSDDTLEKSQQSDSKQKYYDLALLQALENSGLETNNLIGYERYLKLKTNADHMSQQLVDNILPGLNRNLANAVKVLADCKKFNIKILQKALENTFSLSHEQINTLNGGFSLYDTKNNEKLLETVFGKMQHLKEMQNLLDNETLPTEEKAEILFEKLIIAPELLKYLDQNAHPPSFRTIEKLDEKTSQAFAIKILLGGIDNDFIRGLLDNGLSPSLLLTDSNTKRALDINRTYAKPMLILGALSSFTKYSRNKFFFN